MFVKNCGFSRKHFIRQSLWQRAPNYVSPVGEVVARVCVPLSLASFVWLVLVVVGKSLPSLGLEWILGWCIASLLWIFTSLALGFGGDNLASRLRDLDRELGLYVHPVMTAEHLRMKAKTRLRQLADKVKEVEAETDPTDPARDRTRDKFKASHRIFEQAGLLLEQDLEYGQYFKPA
jgi:hypothetical protein